MSDATKIPFEPIPMPPIGPLAPLPPMPTLSDPAKPSISPISDPVKPSFSRSTIPPASALPPTRKPIAMEEDAIPLTKFLPLGIAPESPEPVKKADAAPMPQSWLRRKRMKLIMSAASLGGAAFGLHEFAPHLKFGSEQGDSKLVEVAKPTQVPKIAEERSHDLPKPSVNFERQEELKPLLTIGTQEEPAHLRLAAGVATLPVPNLPTEIQTPAPPVVLPKKVETLAPPALPIAVPETPKVVSVLPPVLLDVPPVVPITLPPVAPVLPPVEVVPPKLKFPELPVETPKPTPIPVELPVETPKPAVIPAPAPATSVATVPLKPLKPMPTGGMVGGITPELEYTSPPETSKPVVAAEPKTDYDVDVHRVKNAETYQTLSEKYYGSAQYAETLKAYNRGADLGQLRDVHVPPMFVIRKMAPAKTPQPTPANDVIPAGVEPSWNGVGVPKPGNGDVRFETYRVPRTGMTMRDVAKAVYGSEREWPRVDNRRNIRYLPDEQLPVGAELQVPVERPDWR